KLFYTFAAGNRIFGHFAVGEVEIALGEELDDLVGLDGERRAAGAGANGVGEGDETAVFHQQSRHQIGIQTAPGRMDGAEACVVEHVLETAVKVRRQPEEITLYNLYR